MLDTSSPDMTFSIVMLPDSAQQTRERLEFRFAGEEALQDRFRALREKGAEFVTNANAEDVRILEIVQRGRWSSAFAGGQFAPAQETTSFQFQKMVAARILATDPSRPEDIVSLATRDIFPPATV
jgi:choline monooxygenase